MALTNHSHVAAKIHESAFNNIITAFMNQRPATFNYATKAIINSGKYCSEINVHPDLKNKPGLEKWTELDTIPLPMTNNAHIDYCVQLSDLKLDFNPANVIDVPPELGGNLEEQEIGLLGKVCGGIACGHTIGRIDIIDIEKEIDRFKKSRFKGVINVPGLARLKIHCFCLELIATLKVKRDDTYLSLDVTGVEIRDIKPEGLENSIECFILKILKHSILPQLKIELEKLTFGFQNYLSLIPTPNSANVPFNPSIDQNHLNVFVNIN